MGHICPVCFDLPAGSRDIFPGKNFGSETLHMTRTKEQVLRSASAGCQGCCILIHGLELAVPNLGYGQIWPFWHDLSAQQPLRVGHTEGGDLEFYVEKTKPTPAPMIGYGHPYASCGLSSAEGFAQIFGWIEDCVKTHSTCKVQEKPVLPTRVIDVGSSDCEIVRLYETQGESSRYNCLSHCWGSLPFIKTETTNIDAHTNGIAWPSLTKTFQEAILVTRKLGIRWLWIDSLCIIQDDSDDWDRESAKMASIYENSHVTLAATSSKDGNGGLFWPDKDREFVHLGEDGTAYSIHVRRLTDDHLVPSWYTRLKTHPLLYRAWCYQERMLAPRVLHFGAHEIMWECRTMTNCECGGVANDTSVKPSLFNDLLASNADNINLAWRHIITEYTHLALTMSADRLPALSGLTKLFRGTRNSEDYLAGLWRQSLPEDLLWYVKEQDSLAEHIIWRAPSWSWVSAPDARIGFQEHGDDSVWHVVVMGAHSTPAGTDPTGRVSGGSLTLKGSMAPANLRIKEFPQPPSLSAFSSHENRLASGLGENISSDAASWSHTIRLDRPSLEKESSHIDSSPLPVFCLKLVTNREYSYVETDVNGRRGDYFEHAVLFLVLRCIDENAQLYERIGLGVQIEEFEDELALDEIQRIRSEVLVDSRSGNIFANSKDDSFITIV